MPKLAAGDVLAKERTFTPADVEAFAAVSLDRGVHHLTPDAQGRLMVHGLHTASLPTQLGGELSYIAREMTFEFVRAVWTGDTVRAELRVETAEERGADQRLSMTLTCTNQLGEVVLRGTTRGVIRG